MKTLCSIAIAMALFATSVARAFESELQPLAIPQGGVGVIYLNVGEGAMPEAVLDGGEVLFRGKGGWVMGLVAADMEAKPGVREMTIWVEGGTFRAQVTVTDPGFEAQRLKLPRRMVDFDPEAQERIEREVTLIKGAWVRTMAQSMWTSPFIMPVLGPVTSEFGSRRVLNGKARSPHNGIDIAAPEGAPVAASNVGRVALTGDFLINGRTVILDHGLGLYTVYSHLRDVFVNEGEMVEGGFVIGTVGSTGRATGPHLHFSVRLGDTRVSPEEFINATLQIE
jgi:hypothetical protein